MTLKEYLDQEEEITDEIVPFEDSPQTKTIFNEVYLGFYYWIRGNEDEIEWFMRAVVENNYM